MHPSEHKMSKRSALGKLTDEDLSKPVKLSKPSLDSDEEDYDDKDCFRLREADIDGQEAATLEYDETIKITPFNMKEELEEDGHFDSSGMFIFKKTVDPRDNWLEDIDWLEVKRRQDNFKLSDTSISDAPTQTPMDFKEKHCLYEELFRYLRPSETVLRSIKRMGACSDSKKSASASERWLRKNKRTESNTGDPQGLIRVTELADQLLQAGDFDIYQKTYEEIATQMRDAMPEDELDALGKAYDKETSNSQNTGQSDKDVDTALPVSSAMWLLKRPNNVDVPVEGPYTTQQLRAWVNEGKFKDAGCILIREADKPNGQFYNIDRIDLDLYE